MVKMNSITFLSKHFWTSAMLAIISSSYAIAQQLNEGIEEFEGNLTIKRLFNFLEFELKNKFTIY